jgi:prepilin-type N-terminal cleavage/methylation domain-containing protein
MTRSHHAFTLIELLAAVAIMAALIVGALFFTASYITWAHNTADQRSLIVLNDALNRYKTEGGNISALTSGAQISHVLTKMATTLNWAGMSHNVMQAGVTYQGRSIDSIGNGASYHFTRYNTYTAELGGSSPAGQISLSGNMAFGNVNTGSTATAELDINNTGTAPLNCSAITLPTGFTSDFAPGCIQAGFLQPVNVTFSPTLVQSYDGTITVTSDAGAGTIAVGVHN